MTSETTLSSIPFHTQSETILHFPPGKLQASCIHQSPFDIRILAHAGIRTDVHSHSGKSSLRLCFELKSSAGISCSAHRTPNFMNPEFQFSQFRLLKSVCVCVCVFRFDILAFLGIF